MGVIASGFIFGLVLQAAIGPISLFIFSLSSSVGFFLAMPAVLGVTLADAVFIFLAITGVTAFMSSEKTSALFRIVGSVVVALFGVLIILESAGIPIIPAISLVSASAGNGAFVKGFLMTAGNPLTIVFWGGVCSVRMTDTGLSRPKMYLFGLGAASSTLICQSAVALAGAGIKAVITPGIMTILNILVGIILLGMAVWPFAGKRKPGQEKQGTPAGAAGGKD